MYELQVGKLPSALESILDSVAAAMGIMKQDTLSRSFVELKNKEMWWRASPSRNTGFLAY